MKNPKATLVIALILFSCYAYSFFLALWGKRLYDETGNVIYIIAFHLLAIVNYFYLDMAVKKFQVTTVFNKPALFFMLHGCLISVFPYAGYLNAGIALMAAALISSAINSRSL